MNGNAGHNEEKETTKEDVRERARSSLLLLGSGEMDSTTRRKKRETEEMGMRMAEEGTAA